MKKIIFILVFTLFMFNSVKAQLIQNEFIATNKLIERIIPGYSKQFKLEKIDPVNGRDVFEIDGSKNKVILRGNSNISLTVALNWYLKYYCNAHMSWCGNQLNLPKQLPVPKGKYFHVIDQKYRVYFNYCTLNYSASWWDWQRWEKEIDFMALNGINMPLSVVGLEAVWYNTLLKFNFTDKEARDFLVGPAFFAWQCMTNIQSHGGPLPKSWIDQRIILGQKIIQRELELGMMPIQQGFSGYVPIELKKKYPKAKILQQPTWGNFPGSAQLDPLDSLFKKFGTSFLEEQKKLFGANHFYAADPFHESTPPENGSEYLNKVGKAIYSLMRDFDHSTTWIMQSWSLRKDIVISVPKDKLLILDLNGLTYKNKENFWGYNFIAVNLHNFGGRVNLHGDLKLLAANQYNKIKKIAPNVIGTGLFMESIIQNPVYYDLAFEMGLSSDSVNIYSWLDNYANRRYGYKSDKAKDAWKMLLNTVYKEGTNGIEKSSIICARPALNVKKSGTDEGFGIPYSNKDLFDALKLLIADSANLKSSDSYRYDIVDILRQVLSNYGQEINKNAADAFNKKDIVNFIKYSQQFLALLTDVDNLLSTRNEFRFQKWISDARSFGKTEQEKDLYEYNASMLVTIWGPESQPEIFDYSWREWSGLIGQYYFMRWQKFYDMLTIVLKDGTSYDESNLPLIYGRETFRANGFYEKLADAEIAWIKSKKSFPDIPKEDELKVIIKLMKKYGESIH